MVRNSRTVGKSAEVPTTLVLVVPVPYFTASFRLWFWKRLSVDRIALVGHAARRISPLTGLGPRVRKPPALLLDFTRFV
jgi:hypothetical protein